MTTTPSIRPTADQMATEVFSMMTRRDRAARKEQAQLALAVQREARGEDGELFRRVAERASAEKSECHEAASRLFAAWLVHTEPE